MVFMALDGLTILNVIPDLMHVKHLGVDQYVYGSVLALLVYVILPGTLFLFAGIRERNKTQGG